MATDDQLEFAKFLAPPNDGWMSSDWKKPTTDIKYLL